MCVRTLQQELCGSPRIAEAKADELTSMTTVKLGILLPHEVFSQFYHQKNGVLFYSLLTGSPGDARPT